MQVFAMQTSSGELAKLTGKRDDAVNALAAIQDDDYNRRFNRAPLEQEIDRLDAEIKAFTVSEAPRARRIYSYSQRGGTVDGELSYWMDTPGHVLAKMSPAKLQRILEFHQVELGTPEVELQKFREAGASPQALESLKPLDEERRARLSSRLAHLVSATEDTENTLAERRTALAAIRADRGEVVVLIEEIKRLETRTDAAGGKQYDQKLRELHEASPDAYALMQHINRESIWLKDRKRPGQPIDKIRWALYRVYVSESMN